MIVSTFLLNKSFGFLAFTGVNPVIIAVAAAVACPRHFVATAAYRNLALAAVAVHIPASASAAVGHPMPAVGGYWWYCA